MNLKVFVVLCSIVVYFSTTLEAAVAQSDNQTEKVDLLELLNSASENDKSREDANNVFASKFGDNLVEISYVREGDIFHWDERIIFIGPTMVEKFLKAFGQSIQKLSIAYNMIGDIEQKAKVGALVNEHCSETLQEFEAKGCTEETFVGIKKPYTKVERVVFSGVWNELGDSNNLSLDKLFPQMRVLNLTYTGGYLLDQHYKNLVELNGEIEPSTNLAIFIGKNPQIKTLRLQKTTVDILKTVNEKLKELEIFAFEVPLDIRTYEGPEFLFENVAEVAITDLFGFFKNGKISFKQLNKIELSVYGKLNDDWIDFITANKNVTILNVLVGTLNDTSFSKLSNELNKLVEAHVRFEFNVKTDDVVEFIEGNPELNALSLTFPTGSALFLNELIDKLGKEWNIATTNSHFTTISLTKLAESGSYMFTSAPITIFVAAMLVTLNVFAF